MFTVQECWRLLRMVGLRTTSSTGRVPKSQKYDGWRASYCGQGVAISATMTHSNNDMIMSSGADIESKRWRCHHYILDHPINIASNVNIEEVRRGVNFIVN